MYRNKTVLITGGNGGLGKNLCLSYAKYGARIINLSRDNDKMKILNKKLDDINNKNNKYFSVDVSKYDQILKVKNQIMKENLFPDIIINNAAGNFLCPFEKLTPNGWKRINDIVLTGAFNIYHIFGKEIINKKSNISKTIFLNISTTYSENSSALVIPSAVSKAGVDNLMKGLTVEWSKYRMRFVGIAPGPIAESGGASKLDPVIVTIDPGKIISGTMDSIFGVVVSKKLKALVVVDCITFPVKLKSFVTSKSPYLTKSLDLRGQP